MNAMAATELVPPTSNAMISISDAPGWGDPGLKPTQFERLLQIYFVDGHYTGDTIREMGSSFKGAYSAYFDRQRAFQIREFIEGCYTQGVQNLYVHCTAGRSRSAAIALWARQQYGYELVGNPQHANEMVLQLLNDPHQFDHFLLELDRESLQPDTSKGIATWIKRSLALLH